MEPRHETGGKGACLTKVRGAWPGTRLGRRGIGAAWLRNWRQPQDLRNGAIDGSHHHELPGVDECGIWAVTERQHRGCTTAPPKKVRRSKNPRTAGPSDMSLGWMEKETRTHRRELVRPRRIDVGEWSHKRRPCCWTLLLTCRPSAGRITAAMVRSMRPCLTSCCLVNAPSITKGKNLPWDGAQQYYHWRHWPIVPAWLGGTESVIPEKKDIPSEEF